MSVFKPFENESQSMTFASGDDELSLENGLDAIVLSGTLTVPRGDAAAKTSLLELIETLRRIAAAV